MLCSLFTDRGNLSQSFEGTTRTQLTYNHQFTGNYWHPGWLLCKSPSGYFQISSKSKLYLKKRLWHRCFLWILRNFKEQLFYRTPLGDCFWTYIYLLDFILLIFLSPLVCFEAMLNLFTDDIDINIEAATEGVFEEVFIKISENSQANTCVKVYFFNEIVRLRSATLKKRLRHRCFPRNFSKFLRNFFSKTPPSDCCCKYLDISCNFL